MADTDLTGLSEINALLGAGTEYEGKLVFQGRVRIDGRFVGEIHGTDVLILGATADVTARIDVGALIVLGGTLRGDVIARRLVELHAPGAVHGDIQTPQLFIDKGATFTGQCAMDGGPAEVLTLTHEARPKIRAGQPSAAPAPSDSGHVDEIKSAASLKDGVSPAEIVSVEGEDDEPFVRAPQDLDSDERDLRRSPRT